MVRLPGQPSVVGPAGQLLIRRVSRRISPSIGTFGIPCVLMGNHHQVSGMDWDRGSGRSRVARQLRVGDRPVSVVPPEVSALAFPTNRRAVPLRDSEATRDVLPDRKEITRTCACLPRYRSRGRQDLFDAGRGTQSLVCLGEQPPATIDRTVVALPAGDVACITPNCD
jgi:hypothetical protein